MDESSVTSTVSALMSTPWYASASLALSRPATITRAPSSWASSATARAMPLPRPTTTTVLSCNALPIGIAPPSIDVKLGCATQNCMGAPAGQWADTKLTGMGQLSHNQAADR